MPSQGKVRIVPPTTASGITTTIFFLKRKHSHSFRKDADDFCVLLLVGVFNCCIQGPGGNAVAPPACPLYAWCWVLEASALVLFRGAYCSLLSFKPAILLFCCSGSNTSVLLSGHVRQLYWQLRPSYFSLVQMLTKGSMGKPALLQAINRAGRLLGTRLAEHHARDSENIISERRHMSSSAVSRKDYWISSALC